MADHSTASSTGQPSRLGRERAFHDRRYVRDPRAPTPRSDEGSPSHEDYRERVMALGRRAEVLEHGCGTGSAAYDLASAGATVTGIDISPVAIERARREADARGVDEHPLRVSALNRAHARFVDVSIRYFRLLALGAVPCRRFGFFPKHMGRLTRLDDHLFERFPYLRRHAWTVVLELGR